MSLFRLDRPITYLYNTFHYYESKLREKAALKKKIVSAILGAFKDIKPPHWAVSEEYTEYMNADEGSGPWTPELKYYSSLISRFVDGQ
jgi:mediator of RNA polymerase II transcription subunit 23